MTTPSQLSQDKNPHQQTNSVLGCPSVVHRSPPPQAGNGTDGLKGGEATEELAHDARNVLAAMGLYCDLLAQPGVLNRKYAHYAGHLKVVVDSGISLVGRLAGPFSNGRNVTAESARAPSGPVVGLEGGISRNGPKRVAAKTGRCALIDLGSEIKRRRGMLSVLLGPRIDFEMECLPCPGSVRLDPVDLGRILVNLVRNAGEAMPCGGRVRITVQQGAGLSFLGHAVPGVLPQVLHEIVPTTASNFAADPLRLDRLYDNAVRLLDETVLLCVHDNGPGIDNGILHQIFDSGFSTKLHFDGKTGTQNDGDPNHGEPSAAKKQGQNAPNANATKTAGGGLRPPPASRGLGLGIVRSLVEAAGGQIRVVSRRGIGTRFEVEFPLLCASVAASAEIRVEASQSNRADQVQVTTAAKSSASGNNAKAPYVQVHSGAQDPNTVSASIEPASEPDGMSGCSLPCPAPEPTEGNHQEGSLQC